MKRILFVMDTLRMGGAEKSLISLLKALDSSRLNVDLFLFEHGGVLQSQVPEWVNILDSDTLTRGMTLELRKYLRDVIKEGHLKAALARIWMTLKSKFAKNPGFNWGIVEPYIPEINTEYDVAIGYLEGFPDFFVLDKVKSKKKIGWIHIDMTGRNPTSSEKKYYEAFDELAIISEECKKAFVTLFPNTKRKVRVIENIVLKEEIIRKAEEPVELEWDKEKINIVSVGRLDYQKGFDIGAQACKILMERGVNICWHVYGKGIMREKIESYIHDNNLEEYYILEGIRTNPYPYMKQADMIVQPSRWEGKSIVLDEAKILGKVIVVTDYPSVKDQIENNYTGIVTNIDAESIAVGIEELVKNDPLCRRLEKNCLQEINYSFQAINDFYEMLEV